MALSREATFLYNNLPLVALCPTTAILWGVLWPIVTQLLEETRTMGRPYYDFLRAFGLPLLLLMGIGPLVAWRKAVARSYACSPGRSASRSSPVRC